MGSLSSGRRRVLEKATEARRAMIDVSAQALPGEQQKAVGAALRVLSQVIGEIPDHACPATPP